MNRTDRDLPTNAHFRLDGRPADVSRARGLVGQFLGSAPTEVVQMAQLLTSEVVSNAVKHAVGHVTLSLDCSEGLLKVQVADGSPLRPVLRHSPGTKEHGRGLLIIESLASSWGVETRPRDEGKTVWFTLRTAPRGPSGR